MAQNALINLPSVPTELKFVIKLQLILEKLSI